MKQLIYLLPDIALLFVLARMIQVHLHVERPDLFVFLSAWLAYSLSLLLVAQAWPVQSMEYERVYCLLTAGVWIFGVIPVLEAGRVVAANRWSIPAFAQVLVLLMLATRAGFAITGATPLMKAVVLTAWASAIAGIIFFCASFDVQDPDKILWRCAGIYFLTFAGGMLGGRAAQRPEFFLGAAVFGMAIWVALASALGPTPDALINIGKLALTPFARAAFGLASLSFVAKRISRG